MKQAISKARTKKTRTREKRAVKTPAEKVPVHQTRLFGLFIGFRRLSSAAKELGRSDARGDGDHQNAGQQDQSKHALAAGRGRFFILGHKSCS